MHVENASRPPPKIFLYLYWFVFTLSVFQFYIIKVSGSYISLYMISVLLLFPLVLMRLNYLRWAPIFTLALLICIQLVSLLWSPDISMGIKQIISEIFYLIIFFTAFKITLFYPLYILKIFKFIFLVLFIPGVLVVIFQIYPDIEDGFLQGIAKLFINPNKLEGLLGGDAPNNVIDVNKAGGFFVNGNVAAAYFGISGFISLGLWKAYGDKVFIIFAFFMFAFAVSTGSKAGIIFIVIFSGFLAIKNGGLITGIFLPPLFLVLLSIIYLSDYFNIISDGLMESLRSRLSIWGYILDVLPENIFLGLGFGGWKLSFDNYAISVGIDERFPPHNTFIYLWSQSGIFAVLITFYYFYALIRFAKRLLSVNSHELRGLGISVLIPTLWILFHGFGTNFGIIGEDHMFILLASVLGFSYARYKMVLPQLKI